MAYASARPAARGRTARARHEGLEAHGRHSHAHDAIYLPGHAGAHLAAAAHWRSARTVVLAHVTSCRHVHGACERMTHDGLGAKAVDVVSSVVQIIKLANT